MVKEGWRKLGARADGCFTGRYEGLDRGLGHIRRNQKMCPLLVRSVPGEQ